MQGLEEWENSDMKTSMKVFKDTFLDGCEKSSREQLAAKARAVAAAPSLTF